MAQSQVKSPLQEKFNALPRSTHFENDVLPILEKHGISKNTFYRDQKSKGSSIPHERLQVYAALLDCDVSDLIDTYVKGVKPIVKKSSIGKRVGLKS